MKNFKEIAEKCLSGELSGTFIIRNHTPLHSKYLYRYKIGRDTVYGYYWLGGIVFDEKGKSIPHKNRIQNFIPDNMQKKIEIDIPEGKVPVMEQTEKGVVITWKEKELTYEDVANKILDGPKHIPGCFYNAVCDTTSSTPFYNKINVLRKLINIRNYFGKPKYFCDGVVIKCINSYCGVETGQFYFDKPDLDSLHEVVFAKKEHAEQAIKMLGDELKYLFEPW